MCCCDCLLVAALQAELADASAERVVPPPVLAINRWEHSAKTLVREAPARLCGWTLLALRSRRWGPNVSAGHA